MIEPVLFDVALSVGAALAKATFADESETARVGVAAVMVSAAVAATPIKWPLAACVPVKVTDPIPITVITPVEPLIVATAGSLLVKAMLPALLEV